MPKLMRVKICSFILKLTRINMPRYRRSGDRRYSINLVKLLSSYPTIKPEIFYRAGL